jgi:hypothetical protein
MTFPDQNEFKDPRPPAPDLQSPGNLRLSRMRQAPETRQVRGRMMTEQARATKKGILRQICLLILATGALSFLAPAAFADYAECLGGPRQTDTLRNPLVPGAPSAYPGQIPTGVPLTPGSGPVPYGVHPGDLGGPAPVTTGYADPSNGSIFPAGGSQGSKYPYGYVGGAGRYPTQSGWQQGMYDYGQGMSYGTGTYEPGSSNAGMGTYDWGMRSWGMPTYDYGQGIMGTGTYEGGYGNYGQQTYESGAGAYGNQTYDGGWGNGGMQRMENGGGSYGSRTYDYGQGNYGQQYYSGASMGGGSQTYDSGMGNGGTRFMGGGGSNGGSQTFDSAQGNGGTRTYSGASMGGGSQTYEAGQGNGGTRSLDGGAGNGGSQTYDSGQGNSGTQIAMEGGARTGAAGTTNSGGPRSNAQQTEDTVNPAEVPGNNYDFQGPLPTVRTFCRYLVILGVVVACVWVAMASISVIMGNSNGASRVVGAVAGLLLLLAGYTIWKIVQMNTFHGNTTGYSNNTRGQAAQRQYNGPVNPTSASTPSDPGTTSAVPGPGFSTPEDPGMTSPVPQPGANYQDPRMKQMPPNYRPTGPYTGHPIGPDRVGSYNIYPAGTVPEPPTMPVINPNR